MNHWINAEHHLSSVLRSVLRRVLRSVFRAVLRTVLPRGVASCCIVFVRDRRDYAPSRQRIHGSPIFRALPSTRSRGEGIPLAAVDGRRLPSRCCSQFRATPEMHRRVSPARMLLAHESSNPPLVHDTILERYVTTRSRAAAITIGGPRQQKLHARRRGCHLAVTAVPRPHPTSPSAGAGATRSAAHGPDRAGWYGKRRTPAARHPRRRGGYPRRALRLFAAGRSGLRRVSPRAPWARAAQTVPRRRGGPRCGSGRCARRNGWRRPVRIRHP